MLEELKQKVFGANLALHAEGLVYRTFGNVSGIDRDSGHVVIKPSGVGYDELTPESMAVVSLEDGRAVEGLKPSSETPTHLELYRGFEYAGGVAHTHSLHATAWAQARKALPALGATHADHFRGPVPCTRVLRAEEIEEDYEANTGRIIVERFAELERLDAVEIPAVLVANHGPFAWGSSAAEAVDNAAVLEHCAKLAWMTIVIDAYAVGAGTDLVRKHYLRKHGPDAYDGQ